MSIESYVLKKGIAFFDGDEMIDLIKTIIFAKFINNSVKNNRLFANIWSIIRHFLEFKIYLG